MVKPVAVFPVILLLTMFCGRSAGQSAPRALPGNKNSFVLPGKWRAVFHINDSTDVPANFEIKGSTAAEARVYFLNGEERFESGTLRRAQDSIFIQTTPFDNELAFVIDGSS